MTLRETTLTLTLARLTLALALVALALAQAIALVPALALTRSQVDALCSELASAFASSQLDDARRLTAQLQYLQRVHEEIDAQTPAT